MNSLGLKGAITSSNNIPHSWSFGGETHPISSSKPPQGSLQETNPILQAPTDTSLFLGSIPGLTDTAGNERVTLLTHLLLFSSLGSRQISAAAGQHKAPHCYLWRSRRGSHGLGFWGFFGGRKKKKGNKNQLPMATAPAPHALPEFGTRSELGVAKSTSWDFPEVSAGVGEEEEQGRMCPRGGGKGRSKLQT